MKKKILNFFTFSIFLPFILFGQQKDSQTWASLEIVYDEVKNTEFLFEGGIRLMDNSSIISKHFIDLACKRKYNNLFSYAVGFRHILDKNSDLIFEKKNRFYIDIFLKESISQRFKLNFRTRFQSQTDSQLSFNQKTKNKLRQKIKMSYDINNTNIDFILSSELFFLFNESSYFNFEKFRLVTGLEKPIGNKIDLNLNFLIQKEVVRAQLFEDIDDKKLWYIFRLKMCYTI